MPRKEREKRGEERKGTLRRTEFYWSLSVKTAQFTLGLGQVGRHHTRYLKE